MVKGGEAARGGTVGKNNCLWQPKTPAGSNEEFSVSKHQVSRANDIAEAFTSAHASAGVKAGSVRGWQQGSQLNARGSGERLGNASLNFGDHDSGERVPKEASGGV